MKYISHIASGNTLTVIFAGRAPIAIPREDPAYDRVLMLIRNGEYDKIPAEADKALGLEEKSHGRFSVKGNQVYVENQALPDALSARIVQLTTHGLPTDSLLNFWDNIMLNPSPESVKDLYRFLEHNHFPLTDDGCFVAYKSVTKDFKDWHTQKISNKPGDIVEMPRSEVNANRNQTCSTGLHVAAYKYAKSFNGGEILMEVKVNPKDVVSVPIDYNAEKMRCCRYEVIRVNRQVMREKVYTGKVSKAKSGAKLKSGIRRLPASQKIVTPDGRGAISIATDILEKLGMKAGDKVYAIVATARARNFRLTTRKPKKTPFFIKELVVGKVSTRIFSNVLASCQIDGGEWYELAFNNGELVVK